MKIKTKKRVFATAALSLFIVILGMLPGLGSPASAMTPVNGCYLGAYYPYSNGYVRGLAKIYSCSSGHKLEVQTCLQQLVTGGWQNVECDSYTTPGSGYIGASVWTNSYYIVCGRWYRSWGWAWVDGATAQEYSNSYKGCT